MGDYVTEGDGNGKKTSKTHAAELMIEKLKELPPVASCQTSIESSQLIKDLGPNMHTLGTEMFARGGLFMK